MLSIVTSLSFAAKEVPNIDPNDMWNDYGGEWLEEEQVYKPGSWVWEDKWNVYDIKPTNND